MLLFSSEQNPHDSHEDTAITFPGLMRVTLDVLILAHSPP
jgi:hypothetical protein